MRQIPRAADPQPQVQQSPIARPDTPGPTLLEAYTQAGVSSVAGIPGIQANTPPPRVSFDQYGNIQADAPFTIPMGPIDPRDPPAPQAPPPIVTAADRTEMMSGGTGLPGPQAAWTPICRGTIDHVLMMADGAHVLVTAEGGGRFAAFVSDRPIIEMGIRVELGIRRTTDTSAHRTRDVADIILID